MEGGAPATPGSQSSPLQERIERRSYTKSSFSAKSGNGIGFGGAESGQERGHETNDRKDERDSDEDERVVRFRSEQQSLHQPRDGGGGEQTEHES